MCPSGSGPPRAGFRSIPGGGRFRRLADAARSVARPALPTSAVLANGPALRTEHPHTQGHHQPRSPTARRRAIRGASIVVWQQFRLGVVHFSRGSCMFMARKNAGVRSGCAVRHSPAPFPPAAARSRRADALELLDPGSQLRVKSACHHVVHLLGVLLAGMYQTSSTLGAARTYGAAVRYGFATW